MYGNYLRPPQPPKPEVPACELTSAITDKPQLRVVHPSAAGPTAELAPPAHMANVEPGPVTRRPASIARATGALAVGHGRPHHPTRAIPAAENRRTDTVSMRVPHFNERHSGQNGHHMLSPPSVKQTLSRPIAAAHPKPPERITTPEPTPAETKEDRGRALLAAARAERRQDPHAIAKTVSSQTENALTHCKEWAAEASLTEQGIDLTEALQRFGRLCETHFDLTGITTQEEPEHIRDLWDGYIEAALAFRAAGLKRPEANAEYNDAGELVEYLVQSTQPKRDIILADLRISDPLGAIHDYHGNVTMLESTFADEPLVSPTAVNAIARNCRPEKALRAMQTHVENLRAIHDQYADLPGANALLTWLHDNYFADPHRIAQRFEKQHATLTELFTGDPDFDPITIGQLGMSTTKSKDSDLMKCGEAYRSILAELRKAAQMKARGPNVTDTALKIAAARKFSATPAWARKSGLAFVRTIDTRLRSGKLRL